MRGRALIHGPVLAILFAIVITAPSPASAAEGASAAARPEVAQLGSSVTLVFTTPEPMLVAADVADSVTCTLQGPDASVVPCGRVDQLATVEVSPSSRSYSMSIMAPLVPGKYVVHFERKALVSLPSTDASAEAPLTVLAAADGGLSFNGAPGSGGPVGGSGDPGPLADRDATRWLASLTMGTAAVVGGVVLARPPQGGRP